MGLKQVVLAGLFIIFAMSLHFLVTVKIGGSPLRMSASDLLLPILGLMLGFLWWQRRVRPIWCPPYIGFWLLAMLSWLGMSVWRGWGPDDTASSWALLKLVGFTVLIGYFAVGGLAASLLHPQVVGWAFRAYVLTAWGVAAYALTQYLSAAYGFHQYPWYPRLLGFAENPNTYGLLASTAWIVQLAWQREGPILGRLWDRIGETLLLATVLLSASRSAYLGLALTLAILVWRRWFPLAAVLCTTALTALLLLILLQLVPWLLAEVMPSEKIPGFLSC